MSLAETQAAFMGQVLDENAPLPEGWGNRHAAGMHIYRGNYRSAQIDALRDTYIKTQGWAGEDPFRTAAIHHVITHPSSSWTIDEAGAGFDSTCAELFQDAPEVAELAWLEWAMLEAFSAADVDPLTIDQFALQTSALDEEQLIGLQIGFVPALACRALAHDLQAMWQSLDTPDTPRSDPKLAHKAGVIVWREGERSTFKMVELAEVIVLDALQSGASYGEACLVLAGEDAAPEAVQEAAMAIGAMLGRWASEGLIAALQT
jgi:hypothetical protein